VTTFTEFWARSAHFRQNGGWDESRGAQVFLGGKPCDLWQLCNGWFSPNWPQNISRCPVDEYGKTIAKIFTLGVICPQNRKSVKQALHSEQATGHGMHCLLHVVVQGPGSFCCGATGHQSCPIFGFWPIFSYKTPKRLKRTFRWPAYSRLHRRMILILPCGSQRSKGVTSGTGVFLRLLVGELGTQNLPKYSSMANG